MMLGGSVGSSSGECCCGYWQVTIPTADGDLLHYSAVASEPLESASKAPAAEVAASSCLRRAAALAGLGLRSFCLIFALHRRLHNLDF